MEAVKTHSELVPILVNYDSNPYKFNYSDALYFRKGVNRNFKHYPLEKGIIYERNKKFFQDLSIDDIVKFYTKYYASPFEFGRETPDGAPMGFRSVHELPKDAKFISKINSIKNAILDYGNNILGINLIDRLPTNENIHLFSPWNFIKLQLRRGADYDKSVSGFVSRDYYNNIFLLREKCLGDMLFNLTHELVHIVGTTYSEPTDDFSIYCNYFTKESTGFKSYNKKGFAAFNEGLTQIITRSVFERVKGIRNKQSILDNPKGYYKLEAFVLRLFEDLSKATGMSFEEVDKIFERGYFLHINVPLQILREVHGDRGIEIVANLTENKYDIMNAKAKLGIFGNLCR